MNVKAIKSFFSVCIAFTLALALITAPPLSQMALAEEGNDAWVEPESDAPLAVELEPEPEPVAEPAMEPTEELMLELADEREEPEPTPEPEIQEPAEIEPMAEEITPMAYADYYAGDIAAMNRIIEAHPELGWQKWTTGDYPPESWNGVSCSWDTSPCRITDPMKTISWPNSMRLTVGIKVSADHPTWR